MELIGIEDLDARPRGGFAAEPRDRLGQVSEVARVDRREPSERRGIRPTPAEAGSLFDTYAHRVRGYIAFRVSDPADADDLTSEVFRRVVAGPLPIDQGTWPTWLFKVAHNAVIDHYRRRRFPNLGAFFAEPPDEAPALPDRVIRDEELRRVDRALARLPGRQRAAIYLRYYEDLDYGQIAEILGMPAVTARSLVHRGLKRLAGDLTRQEVR